jgi:aspartate carbamoyltransferase catalytic subunit
MRGMKLSFPHLVSADQITRSDADALLERCEEMEKALEQGGDDRLKNKVLACLFYEPSTRTRLSFETAMLRLGGQVVSVEGMQGSSLTKGESVEDTIRVVGGYADAIAMRHPEEGSADKAASISAVPFINAGDGPNQHPTQGLLDLLTARKERGTVENLTVAIAGDLKFGRTVHSFSTVISLFPGTRFRFITPSNLRMPAKVTDLLKQRAVPFEESEDLQDGLDADILYMTRIQKERFESVEEYERLKDAYVLHAKDLAGKSVTVMHALPRNAEIAPDVDELPNAAYFRQAQNGVPVRMALLSLLLS